MTPEYAEIQRLLDAVHAACSDARMPQTRQAVRAIRNELLVARATVADAFAEQHGWERAPKGFTLHELRNGHYSVRWTDGLWPNGWPEEPIDHAEYYRFAWRRHFPAAIVSHEYGPFENSLAFAKANGLIATRLPASWYDPARATAVVYTSPLIPFSPFR